MTNRLAHKALQIIRYSNPPFWLGDNPQDSSLRRRKFMSDLTLQHVDMFLFEDKERAKLTKVWSPPSHMLTALAAPGSPNEQISFFSPVKWTKNKSLKEPQKAHFAVSWRETYAHTSSRP